MRLDAALRHALDARVGVGFEAEAGGVEAQGTMGDGSVRGLADVLNRKQSRGTAADGEADGVGSAAGRQMRAIGITEIAAVELVGSGRDVGGSAVAGVGGAERQAFGMGKRQVGRGRRRQEKWAGHGRGILARFSFDPLWKTRSSTKEHEEHARQWW